MAPRPGDTNEPHGIEVTFVEISEEKIEQAFKEKTLSKYGPFYYT